MSDLDQTAPARYLPPDKRALKKIWALAENILGNVTSQKLFEAYLDLAQQCRIAKNPYHRDFLLELERFFWKRLSPQERNDINRLKKIEEKSLKSREAL